MKNALLSIVLGLLATASMNADVILADSQADFSSTQGYKGWAYGYYTSEFNYATFTQYNTYSPGAPWINSWNLNSGFDYGFISVDQVYPGPNNNSEAVRRWVSTTAGTVTISGIVQKAEAGQVADWNNGVRIRILVNGNDVGGYTNYIAGQDASLHAYSTSATIAVGDKIDFVLDPYWNNGYDRSFFTSQITTVPEPGMLALLAVGGLVVLKRRRA